MDTQLIYSFFNANIRNILMNEKCDDFDHSVQFLAEYYSLMAAINLCF